MKKYKADKGFELIYWNLSYRRKFIRTLWMTPFFVIILAFTWFICDNFITNIILTILLVAILLIQLIYNYSKSNNCKNS